MPCSLALTCVNELSRVLLDTYDLEQIDPQAPHKTHADFVFFPALSYAHLGADFQTVKACIRPDATLVAFVFDAYFSTRYDRIPQSVARHTRLMRSLRKFSAIYTPFHELLDEQIRLFDLKLKFMAIGVDAMRFAEGVPSHQRWIDVNAYGRQPDALVEALADDLNATPGRLFHYTRHANASFANDPIRHRQLFWRMLNSSRIALAYSPESCDPRGRFPCSFVGQRWFEALAAGCVVAGIRPHAPEAASLLDWDGATIELPDRPDEAVEAIKALLDDRDFLAAQSIKNTSECIMRHDWRMRLAAVEDDFPQFRALHNSENLDTLIARKLATVGAAGAPA